MRPLIPKSSVERPVIIPKSIPVDTKEPSMNPNPNPNPPVKEIIDKHGIHTDNPTTSVTVTPFTPLTEPSTASTQPTPSAEPSTAASTQPTPPKEHRHPLNVRFQALALAEYGIPLPQIAAHLKISAQIIQRLQKTARLRGFNPALSPILKLEYVEDAHRSGRPFKVTPDVEAAIVKKFLDASVAEGKRKKITKAVTEEFGLSSTTVLRVLERRGLEFVKEVGGDGNWKVTGNIRGGRGKRVEKWGEKGGCIEGKSEGDRVMDGV